MKKNLLLIAAVILFLGGTAFGEEEKWSGVDESVVGKFARELGREPQDPLINTDQGDMLLFVFTLAGTVGGFVVGYQWHKLFVAGRVDPTDMDENAVEDSSVENV